MSEKQDMDKHQMTTNLVPQWLSLMSMPCVDPSKLRLVGTEMGNEIMLLQAEIERLRTEVEEMRARIAKLVEDNDCIPELEAEIERLQAALKDAREFVAGMVTPSKYPTVLTISSYHPCHALIDKIDAALGPAHRRTEQENAGDQEIAPCDDAEFGMKP